MRLLLFVLVAFTAACGSGGDDGTTAPPVVDASTLDGATPAVDAGTDATLPADASAPLDATTPDALLADASPPSSTVVTGCDPGSPTVTMTSGSVTVAYDLTAGIATFTYGALPRVTGFYAGVQLASYVTSKDYAAHACTTSGDRTVVTSTGSGLPTMQQLFVLGGAEHFLTQVSVSNEGQDAGLDAGPLSATWMGPVVVDSTGSVDLAGAADPRVLWVPFDNDSFVSYNAAPLAGNVGTGFEVAAFYDNASRHGVVVGSVTHDTWKTGIYYVGTDAGLSTMNVFGGATDATWTHDVLPHGAVSGATVSSPTMFVGAGDDWRDLLEEYATANATEAPMLAWDAGVPFGWNSWGTLRTNVSYDAAVAASDFLRGALQPAGFEDDDVVYVNLDSYWTNFTSAQLTDFVAHVHGNGQKAGIYWTPWVDWGESATRQVEGTSLYTYQQIWLRDGSGNPIALDGAYAVDPTHPGTQQRVDYTIGQFRAAGFDYVKLDFLTHGALESAVRYDPTVTTGIAAYNAGMQYVLASIGGTMFVSESIAPLFPYRYGHARRVSCDVGGAASTSAYELNSAAYGWWMSGRLYRFNDPDMMTFQGYGPADNLARLISAAISGTVFLDGDDLSSDAGQSVAAAALENKAIDAVARLGVAFRPVEGNTGTSAPSAFVYVGSGVAYLALFNFTSSSATETVDLARAGLSGTTTYTMTNLWTGATSTASGSVSASLGANGSALLELQ